MSNSLAKNSIFNVCYQLLNVIFPLISASYVARVLMPSGVGLVAMAQNWVAYFVIFASLGCACAGFESWDKESIYRAHLNQCNLHYSCGDCILCHDLRSSKFQRELGSVHCMRR